MPSTPSASSIRIKGGHSLLPALTPALLSTHSGPALQRPWHHLQVDSGQRSGTLSCAFCRLQHDEPTSRLCCNNIICTTHQGKGLGVSPQSFLIPKHRCVKLPSFWLKTPFYLRDDRPMIPAAGTRGCNVAGTCCLPCWILLLFPPWDLLLKLSHQADTEAAGLGHGKPSTLLKPVT